ncbi:cation:H+ antiporter [Halogranum amylolyticum]|uniref:Cation:H+ antiporter n=1 Tax=Halogranum amylolyticum TaxID=660520 RepID=A0A1H8TIM3_9EURY|nr:sodium:proton exchanger [Halogranum amylolyticum]SEO90636.1 cation:H+ antiporter [Halogranum amylolyticum]
METLRTRLGRVLLVAIIATVVTTPAGVVGGIDGPIGTVGAQEEAGEEEAEEGGIEGAIQGFAESWGLPGAVAVLVVGVVLLTAATEKLISYLTRASLGLRMSLFALAILFTGFEFDDTAVALVFSAGDLEGAALGTALGTALAIVGITLALAAVIRPFPVDIPSDYLLLLGLTPLVLVPFASFGTLTLVHGVILIAVCALLFGYIILRERQRDTPVFRSSDLGERIRADGGAQIQAGLSEIPEDRLLGRFSTSGWVWIGLSIVALVGIVFASMLLEAGSEVVIEGFGLSETVFGATALTLILTFEDIVLTLEPVRRGVPEIGVGNVIGSVLFSVTGNVGVIMLLSDLTIASSVLTFHLPAVVVMTAIAAYFLSTGRMERRHGMLLGGLYVGYWIVAVFVCGGVPISG